MDSMLNFPAQFHNQTPTMMWRNLCYVLPLLISLSSQNAKIEPSEDEWSNFEFPENMKQFIRYRSDVK